MSTTQSDPVPSVPQTLFTAAWMAIVLGLGVQLIVLMSRLLAGATPKPMQVFIDFAGGVSWSVIVCGGVSLGIVASRNTERMMGLLGLLFAPLAWAGAKGVQRGMQSVLDEPFDTLGPLVFLIGAVKMVEYGLLGYLLGRLIRTTSATLSHHAVLGVVVGVVAGALILGLNLWYAPGHVLPLPKLVAIAVNELIFPAGCSVVVYFLARLGDHHSAFERVVAGGG